MTGRIGVAISTTGQPHRLELLRQSVAAWDRCLPDGAVLFITVDGSADETETVRQAVYDWTGSVFRVGQAVPREGVYDVRLLADLTGNRLGVAANKNTGIELLMDARVDHLFLSDDDTWPLYPASITKHLDLGFQHSMVCWGRHRLDKIHHDDEKPTYDTAVWTWPRGVMLYMHRNVINSVGGMDEHFGAGGHEHVEYSQRVYNTGNFISAPFISPASYATRNGMGAAALWHAEDMPRPGEKLGDHRLRRRNLTTISHTAEQWTRIEQVMAERAGSSDYVPYHAAANGRASATLCTYTPSRGAGQA